MLSAVLVCSALLFPSLRFPALLGAIYSATMCVGMRAGCEQVSLVVRAKPEPSAAEVGKVVGKGSLVMATGLAGDYVR